MQRRSFLTRSAAAAGTDEPKPEPEGPYDPDAPTPDFEEYDPKKVKLKKK